MLIPPQSDMDFDLLVIGATGLVGSNFVKAAQSSRYVRTICVLARHETNMFKMLDKVSVLVESDSSSWPRFLSTRKQNYDVVFSALGTAKKSIVGSFHKDLLEIDKDLNLAIAKVCKEELNAKTFALVSSFNSFCLRNIFSYFRIKHDIEQALIALRFERTLILQPGPVIGNRTTIQQDQTFTRALSNIIATMFYRTSASCLIGYSIKAKQVAEAAVYILETRNYSTSVDYIESTKMLSLSQALQDI